MATTVSGIAVATPLSAQPDARDLAPMASAPVDSRTPLPLTVDDKGGLAAGAP